jgi:hypothetical protein
MKCKEFKYFLLGCENPDQPPADIKAHLASCSDCQDWQNRMALIEMNIPFLPVPASAARSELLQRILSQPPIAVSTTKEASGEKGLRLEITPSSSFDSRSLVGPRLAAPTTRRKTGIITFFRAMEPSARRFAVGGMAAAVLLVVFGWLVIRTPHRPISAGDLAARRASDPLVATILYRDIRLAESDSAVDRFRALADLADDFSSEVKSLAPLPEAKDVLDDLVRKYEKVVTAGLVGMAGELPGGERVQLLDEVGERLHKAGREVDELGEKLGPHIPKASRQSLKHLTDVALAGDKKLRDMREITLSQAVGHQPSDEMVLARKEQP